MPNATDLLLVEDSKFFGTLLKGRIENDLGLNVVWKKTYAEAVELLDCCRDQFIAALLDITLPDAPDGEIVAYALRKGIPSIIFTGGFDGRMREKLLSWNVVDYILKDSGDCVGTLLHTITRIIHNRDVKILVVDDSRSTRDAVVRLLKAQLYQVMQAADGLEALEIMRETPDILLVVTDYDMPRMDGFQLIKALREEHPKSRLAIIGMSASGDSLTSARLLKSGATDFVYKPFNVEEFHSRVGNAVDMLEQVALIRRLSETDALTGLYNRRYYFDHAPAFMERATAAGTLPCVAMLDIDHFKRVNDTHGHGAGDSVLSAVASAMLGHFPENAIVSRFGGEEFCVLTAAKTMEEAMAAFDGLRGTIESMTVNAGGASINVTISIGLACGPDGLDALLKLADSRLYTAKESGRNRVVGPPPRPTVRG
jgi:diguanylate cyclase (GGDEF)-like protein